MKLSDTLLSWHHAVVMTAFAMQFVVSCKPKSSHDLRSSSVTQKSEANRTIEPAPTIRSPQLQKLTETVDPDERVKLVVELGEQKVVEAVPYLVTSITDVKSSVVSNAMDWDHAFPCSAALVQIGDAAVPQIQKQVTITASEADQLMLLYTLIRIKGAQFVTDWLETLKPDNNTNLPEDRLNELRKWVQSQVQR